MADERISEVIRDVEERLRETSLTGAPVVQVAAPTGRGLPRLLNELDELVSAGLDPGTESPARLWVDRSFTIKGAGTVVTGTLLQGELRTGDELVAQPSGVPASVRELQVHKEVVERVEGVARVAINLRGPDRRALSRGELLGPVDTWLPTSVVDVTLRQPQGWEGSIGRGAFVLHVGTAEVPVRVRVFGSDPETEADRFARLLLDRPLPLVVGDRFILRDVGRRATVGGGEVLDVDPPKRAGRDRTGELAAMAAASPERRSALRLEHRGLERTADGWRISEAVRGRCADAATRQVDEFHRAHPEQQGCPPTRVSSAIAALLRSDRLPAEDDLVRLLLERLIVDGRLEMREGRLALPSFHSIDAHPAASTAEQMVADAEPMPPTIEQLVEAGIPRHAVEATVAAGRLVKISDDLVVTPGFIDEALATLAASTSMSVGSFRAALGTSRKYAVPLLEHLDRTGFTRRVGDERVLTGKAPPAAAG